MHCEACIVAHCCEWPGCPRATHRRARPTVGGALASLWAPLDRSRVAGAQRPRAARVGFRAGELPRDCREPCLRVLDVSDFLAFARIVPRRSSRYRCGDGDAFLVPRGSIGPRIPVDHEPYLLQARIVLQSMGRRRTEDCGSLSNVLATLTPPARGPTGWRVRPRRTMEAELGLRRSALRFVGRGESRRQIAPIGVDIEEERSPLLGRNGIVSSIWQRWIQSRVIFAGMLRRRDRCISEMDTIRPSPRWTWYVFNVLTRRAHCSSPSR